MNYILEYHEERGQWHYNNGTKKQNTFGWQTVAEDLTVELCAVFTEYFDMHYLDNATIYPKLAVVKDEWVKFMDYLNIMRDLNLISDKLQPKMRAIAGG